MRLFSKIGTWLKRQDWGYRFQQLIILLAHLLLLRWMIYTLSEAGLMTTQKVLLHFTGMAIYGGLLIRGTALWAKWRYQREQRQQKNSHEQQHTDH